jgi:uroporphyrinogen decarboxylase
MNELFLDALKGENHSRRPPVWFMRQAGRYMASYRKLRKKYSFLGLCSHPDLICQCTRLPIDEFHMDAAIVFSDILLIAQALGFDLFFEEGGGPKISPVLETKKQVDKLYGHLVGLKLSYVFEGIENLKKTLDVPLIGFAGGPCTVASYLIEGEGKKNLRKTKAWGYNEPESFHKLLGLLTDSTIEYIRGQIDAGVDAIQIFESCSQYLSYDQFATWCFPYLKKIVSSISGVPVILYFRSSSFADMLASLKPAALSVDCPADLLDMRKRFGTKLALQGNLDPEVLLLDKGVVVSSCRDILKKMKGDPAYIFNLGSGILPETPEENVRLAIETIRTI